MIPCVPVPQSIHDPCSFSHISLYSLSGSIMIILLPRAHSPRASFFTRVDFPLPDFPIINALEFVLVLDRSHILNNAKLPEASLPK